jgi:hypothetical protein
MGERGSGAMIYVPNFINIDSEIQKHTGRKVIALTY